VVLNLLHLLIPRLAQILYFLLLHPLAVETAAALTLVFQLEQMAVQAVEAAQTLEALV
jgi:hypothetical protein